MSAFAFALAFAFAADFLTKAVVVRVLAPGEAVPIRPRAPMRLRHVRNRRLLGSRTLLLACWLPIVVGSAVLAHTVFGDAVLAQVGLGLAAGGATGNAGDLVRRRDVVDFIDLRIWPVFNLADAAITCGLALTVVGVL